MVRDAGTSVWQGGRGQKKLKVMQTYEKQKIVTNYQARNYRGAEGLVSPEYCLSAPGKMCWT